MSNSQGREVTVSSSDTKMAANRALDDAASKLNNILPSYHMFKSTISQTLTSSQEDFTSQPPMYEMTPVTSAAASVVQSPLSPYDSVDAFPFPTVDPEVDDEAAQVWENTIFGNFHHLKNLDRYDNVHSKNLNVDIKFTADVCQIGQEPKFIDRSDLELKQGDFIHGYVTIENTGETPIGFSMLYVILEGTIVVLENDNGLIDTQKPKTVHQFLTMPDLFASWTYANIDRLTTDHGYPHDWCEGESDPYDGTTLSLDLKKLFMPHVKYKRFFSFKLPPKLLDDICDPHSLDSHGQLPPTLGFPKHHGKPSSYYAHKEQQVNDLSFMDTSISYCVSTRIIGRASQYDAGGKEFVLAKEAAVPLRVVPTDNFFLQSDPDATKRYFQAFNKVIDQKIETGSLLNSQKSMSELNLSPVSSQDSKVRQLYKSSNVDRELKVVPSPELDPKLYRNTIAYKKRGLLSSKSSSGTVSLSTPKTEYRVSYIPPPKYRKGELPDMKLNIPLRLESYHTSKTSVEVKTIKAEVVGVTFRSPRYVIPTDFHQDLYLPDHSLETGNFKMESDQVKNAITRPAKQRLDTINELILQHGEAMLVERQNYNDLKALANLTIKVGEFPIADIITFPDSQIDRTHVNDIKWDNNQKKFNLEINLHKATTGKSQKETFFNSVTLVPSFQSCLVVRLYHIKITVKLSNGDHLVVRVPMKVENM